ncbi:MAG: CxxC motif-containing protein (DUF1111 family) [Flavobacteriales bacterium]|jgi:CxxC motif-containing protein (DUF1111 family)
MKYLLTSIGLLAVVVGMTACEKLTPKAPEANEALAAPIDGLTPNQMALHIMGDEDFAHIFSVAEGLGPVFVQASCENCHAGDGKGNPFNNLTRFGKYVTNNGNQVWSPMLNEGGPQLQHRSITPYSPEEIPSDAASSQFLAPNVTGLGYLAAVTDTDILAMADPNDSDNDGISGVVNLIPRPEWLIIDNRYHQDQGGDRFIGRFGRKAATINLTHQTVGAYKQDMGITSDFDPVDPVNYAESQFGGDGVADPEIGAGTVEKVVFYLQTLQAPQRRDANTDQVLAGETIFKQIGCNKCHVETLHTGLSEIAALNQVSFHPYTDMLLHDMGAELDDYYTEGIVATNEWRTMALWGLGLQEDSQGGQQFLMHDGRAKTFSEAIDYHGGEGAASRTAYNQLSEEEKINLQAFLNSL